MTLSDDERRKFALYCRETAQQNEQLAAQMKKVNTPTAVVQQYEWEGRAFAIVARVLESTSTEGIG